MVLFSKSSKTRKDVAILFSLSTFYTQTHLGRCFLSIFWTQFVNF